MRIEVNLVDDDGMCADQEVVYFKVGSMWSVIREQVLDALRMLKDRNHRE